MIVPGFHVAWFSFRTMGEDQAMAEQVAAIRGWSSPATALADGNRQLEKAGGSMRHEPLPVALIMIEGDSLTRCNDTHGGHAGDDGPMTVAKYAISRLGSLHREGAGARPRGRRIGGVAWHC